MHPSITPGVLVNYVGHTWTVRAVIERGQVLELVRYLGNVLYTGRSTSAPQYAYAHISSVTVCSPSATKAAVSLPAPAVRMEGIWA